MTLFSTEPYFAAMVIATSMPLHSRSVSIGRLLGIVQDLARYSESIPGIVLDTKGLWRPLNIMLRRFARSLPHCSTQRRASALSKQRSSCFHLKVHGAGANHGSESINRCRL